ncbi:MAG: hypothetical protein QW667_00770 [Candidatus Bathyarchaeia archaeon]
MGRRCIDLECPYLADDGTCLLSENELKWKCRAIERAGHEERDEWFYEFYKDFVREQLRSLAVLE